MLCCDDSKCKWTHSIDLSYTVRVGDHSRYDVNTRSLVAFREIGGCLSQSMTPPYFYSNYNES